MYSKVSFCMITFLFFFFFVLSSFVVARPLPTSSFHHANQQPDDSGEANDMKVELEDRCEGIAEEECFMRRTLAAHVDYIYTQKTKP
ncbi:phytosulfokines-like [Hibiscus syriacus]|uniref:phytosulfokines-like n=1 Tax=Hibiscus syriacus TaxID=106335 RepID=UPI00192122DF|nr:phytosulfokines-like [Hibiscus syriacus]